MAEDVRLAIDPRAPPAWPPRCPRCGSAGPLVRRELRVLRMIRRRRPGETALRHFMLGDVNFGAADDNASLALITCEKHARTNQLGGALLRRDVLGDFMRLLVHLGMAWALLVTVATLRSGGSLVAAFASLPAQARALAAWGVAGEAALAWARHVAWVRPLRLDENFQTLTLRIRDVNYAREFKSMNRAATRDAPVSARLAGLRVTPARALTALAAGLLAIEVCERLVAP